MYKKLLLAAILLLTGVIVWSLPTQAISGWNAGRIIDDSVFTASSSMSASQIQSFLNGKVPSCDTNGQKLSEYGGPDLNKDGKVQRWEWGKAKYNQTKFVCLKNWKNSSGKSAASIIYSKAQKYKISPKVLLVLLQKEQGLVKDTWPLNIQYKTATGYGCPDTAPCDSQYYGLENQLDWAAKMFRAILDNSPSWYTPYELGSNYIQYSPNASCGGKTVNIENRATQALYNYTPYTPNKATLDAGWGTASCGAYGNRNFYLYFTDWFGSTRDNAANFLVNCDDQYYIAEILTSKRYPIDATGLKAWGLTTDDAITSTSMCAYPTSTSLDNVVRSKTTNRLYLVDLGRAYYLSDQNTASQWGVSNINSTSYPVVEGATINNYLGVDDSAPLLTNSDNPSRSDVYLINAGKRYTVSGSTSGDTASTQLVSGYTTNPVREMSAELLQTLPSSGTVIDSSFTVGSSLYLLNHGNLLKVEDSDKAKWTSFLPTGSPALDASVLNNFPGPSTVSYSFTRNGTGFRISDTSHLLTTRSTDVISNWDTRSPLITQLLTNKLLSGKVLSNILEMKSSTRVIQCTDGKYFIERGIRHKRLITSEGLAAWNFNRYYFFENDPGCAYSAYGASLGNAVRSRNTGKVYYIQNGTATYVSSASQAAALGIGDPATTTYPQFNPSSILDNATIH